MNRHPPASLAVAGVVLVAFVAAGAALHDGSELRLGSDARVAWFVALQSVAALAYFAACATVLRAPPSPRTVWLVLAVAIAVRAVPFASPVFLSSDLFRYIWDGRVQLAGHNPYAMVPADPALAGLRDAAIYPHVNRADYARTIYPPAAQIVFAAVAWVSESPRAMRAAMGLFEVVAVGALLRALRVRRQPSSRVLVYAWNPLAAWEFAGNGHVDAVAVGLLAVALLAASLDRQGAAGAALAAAALVKFLPAVAAPALWRARGRAGWRFPVGFVATGLALYGCYAGAGTRLLGFLGGYAGEEGLADGSGLWAVAGLARIATLPDDAGRLFLAAAALGLAGWGVWRLRHPGDPAAGAGAMMVALMLALGPHYPWYYPWLAVAAVLAPSRAAIWLSAAAVLLYVDPLHERFVWPSLLFAPALVLVGFDVLRPLRLPADLTTAPRLAAGEC